MLTTDSDAIKEWLFTPAEGATSPVSCNATTLLVALTYYVLFNISHRLKFLEPKGLQLSIEDRIDWHNRLMSSLSAFCLLAVSLPAVPEALSYTVTECYYGYSLYQDLACRLFVGFLAYDIFHLIKYQMAHDSTAPLFLLHHVLFMVVGLYGISGSYFKFHFLWLISGEASNPLVNLRWHLAVTGHKGLLYLLNGIAVTIIFFAARVLLYGYGLWHLTVTRHMWLGPGAPAAFAPIMSLVYMGYAMQLYWFVLIFKALVRALTRSTKRSKKE